jgi:hypothetical protein
MMLYVMLSAFPPIPAKGEFNLKIFIPRGLTINPLGPILVLSKQSKQKGTYP